jgi:hypothetical protein
MPIQSDRVYREARRPLPTVPALLSERPRSVVLLCGSPLSLFRLCGQGPRLLGSLVPWRELYRNNLYVPYAAVRNAMKTGFIEFLTIRSAAYRVAT